MSDAWLDSAKRHGAAGRPDDALADAWKAYDAAPRGRPELSLLTRILRDYPALLTPDRAATLEQLLRDRDVDPGAISAAGWRLLGKTGLLDDSGGLPSLAARLETSSLALTLLSEDVVADRAAEAAMTRLRAWMLTSGSWHRTPRLAGALIAQAALNGGAWLFGAAESAALASAPEFASAYLPARSDGASGAAFSDPVTRAVAAQYEGWPYPQWKRITPAASPTTLARYVREFDPDGPDTIPEPSECLIAGCGTGRQAALLARRLPDARFTAIDVSAASLRYAASRCGELGIGGVDFQALDLHEVGTLKRTFDAVFCTGVLHHLPDPERGWAALAGVLKPGGVMQVMVYSKIARLSVRALRKSLGDLEGQAMSDDLLREARRRIMALRHGMESRDFYSLAGIHDLLLHRHEDPFDLPRIRRALDALGLRLIHFAIPRADTKARYRVENPHDPLQRDFDGWSKLERDNPSLFAGMYEFWCRKAAG